MWDICVGKWETKQPREAQSDFRQCVVTQGGHG